MSGATSGAALTSSRISLRSFRATSYCDKTTCRANHSKPVQPFAEKYSAFVLTQISRITPPVSPQDEGRSRTSRTRGEMRWTREPRLTCAPDAYGEVVWFGRRGAGVKRAIGSAGDGGKRAVLREEHEVSRKAIAQGRPECFPLPCMLVCNLLCANRTRDRGCSKHPVFPAPSVTRGPEVASKARTQCAAR